MKKIFSTLLCFVIFASIFAGCSDKKAEPVSESSAEEETVIADELEKKKPEKPEGKTPITEVYASFEDDDETPMLLNEVIMLSKEDRDGDAWEVIDTKEEMIFYLEWAKDEGGKKIAYLISDPTVAGDFYGPTYEVDEVIDGYKDGTWNFDNAEADYEKQSKETKEKSEKEQEQETTNNESAQANVSDKSSSGGSADSLIKLAQRQVNNWTVNEINDCVYKSEYDESTGLMIVNAIFINPDEANPTQKAAEVEKFIIEKIRLNDIQSADSNFHLGIIIADRDGNVLLSSVDGKRKQLS